MPTRSHSGRSPLSGSQPEPSSRVLMSWKRARELSGVSYWAIHELITSQRPHLLLPSSLGVKISILWILGGHKHSADHSRDDDAKSSFSGFWWGLSKLILIEDCERLAHRKLHVLTVIRIILAQISWSATCLPLSCTYNKLSFAVSCCSHNKWHRSPSCGHGRKPPISHWDLLPRTPKYALDLSAFLQYGW